MGAQIIARRVIYIPCMALPIAACGRIEIGMIETDSGSYRVRFEANFSRKPAVVITGVGVYEISIPLLGTLRLPIPIILTRITEDYFDYWLPAGHAIFSYIAAES